MPKSESTRRHLNSSQRRALKTAELAAFLKATGRKAQKGVEPNDRHYDRGFAKSLRRMPPLKLDLLIREDEDD